MAAPGRESARGVLYQHPLAFGFLVGRFLRNRRVQLATFSAVSEKPPYPQKSKT